MVESSPHFVKVIEAALTARTLDAVSQSILPDIARMTQVPAAVLYVADSRLHASYFAHQGLEAEAVPEIEAQCEQLSGQTSRQQVAGLVWYPLQSQESPIGLMGLALEDGADPPALDSLLPLLAAGIDRVVERVESERRLAHLNTYLTVSSMLAQSMDLHELLEIALYCCMEAASVLLLDDAKEHFSFYQIEGPAKPILATATFPADQGVAGSVLASGQSEIVNDVTVDDRFYVKFDSESGFQTRNMIAVPLVAGEEQIGVLEVLNKADGGPFTEEEHLLLVSIAEEIAFAIRNAKVFEYVVNTYCKQRQGQMSCKGCERPLGSWTPCVKYREALA
jgi:GAF domain-containing protein